MKVDRKAILETISVLESDILVAKLGCRRRGLQLLKTPQEGVHWILQQNRRQRDLQDLKQAVHPLYAALAHVRGRIHAIDGNNELKPRMDPIARKPLPLEEQTPEFQRAWAAQEAFVQPVIEAFGA